VNTGERRILDSGASLRRAKTGRWPCRSAGLRRSAGPCRPPQLADGDYPFADYCDEDSVGGDPLRLNLVLRIQGDSAILDFTGTDPQTLSSLNVPTGGHPRHSLILVGVYYVLSALSPKIMLNFGTTRPFTCILPQGSVLNPAFPAAVGMRSLTCARLRSLVFGAFAQAAPERLAAAPAGSSCIINLAAEHPRSGRRVIAAIAPIVGGGGGMPHRDGNDGSGADAALPQEQPDRDHRIRSARPYPPLRPDAGYGRRWCASRRPGDGDGIHHRCAEATVTARNRDRSIFRPWGILGGKPGAASSFTLNPGGEHKRRSAQH